MEPEVAIETEDEENGKIPLCTTIVVHYGGKWRSGPIFYSGWGDVDYIYGKMAYVENVVAETLTTADLCTAIGRWDKKLRGHIMVFTIIRDGKKQIICNDDDLQSWWSHVKEYQMKTVLIYLDHEAPSRSYSSRKKLGGTNVQKGKAPKKKLDGFSKRRLQQEFDEPPEPLFDQFPFVSGAPVVEVFNYQIPNAPSVEEVNVTPSAPTTQQCDELGDGFWTNVSMFGLLSEQAPLITDEDDVLPDPKVAEKGKKVIELSDDDEDDDGVEDDGSEDNEPEDDDELLDVLPDPHGHDPTVHELPVEEDYHSGESEDSDYAYDPEKDGVEDKTGPNVGEQTTTRVGEQASWGHDTAPPTDEWKGVDEATDDLYGDDESGVQNNSEGPYDKMVVGMIWLNRFHCRRYLRRYAVRKRFEFRFKKNDKKRIRVKCVNKDCPWFFFASKMRGQQCFKLKTFVEKHKCNHLSMTENRKVNCKFVAEELEDAIRVHRQKSYKPIHIIDEFWKEFTINISYWVAWRARGIALERIYGNYDRAYELVPELCRQVLLANPKSIATWKASDIDRSFEGLCIGFKPYMEGFMKYCRPMIGLDGCFLKGKYGGVCLAATALDGNNGLYPLAIYICQSECYDTWWKFLDTIKPHISKHNQMISFISDRQKGLKEAVANLFPHNPHRFCFRHYYANFKKLYKGDDLKHLAWGAAKAYEKTEYKVWAEQIKKVDEGAYKWLHDSEKVETWARSHFDVDVKSEHVTNNFSESFNKWIIDLREWPVVAFVEKFHLMLMTLLYDRKRKAKGWERDGLNLVPRVQRILDGHQERIRFYRVHGSHDRLYGVSEWNTSNRWIVDIENRTCSCCVWDITGVPCVHAVAVLNPSRPDWTSYCSEYHSVKNYLGAYEGFITPMATVPHWDEPNSVVIHPYVKPKQGTPKKQRIRGQDEGPSQPKTARKCGNCGGMGHNTRTCSVGKESQPGPTKRRRTKKNVQVRGLPTKVGTSKAKTVGQSTTPTVHVAPTGGPSIAPTVTTPRGISGPAAPAVGGWTRPPQGPALAASGRPSIEKYRQQKTAEQTTANFKRVYGHMPDHIRAPFRPPEQVFRPNMMAKGKK